MSAFAVFGLCLGIVIIFLIIVGVMIGPQFYMLFIFFPVLISEAITGQRGSFHPNGATKKAPFFEGVLLLSVILQVLLLSSLLFGIYCLIAGIPSAPTLPEEVPDRIVLAPVQVSHLLLVNGLLWLLAGIFLGLFLVNTFRFWKEINRMPKGRVLINHVFPLLMFAASFYFLSASRSYLKLYPQGDSYLSGIVQAIAVFYGVFLLLFKINEIYMYVAVLRKQNITLWKGYWLTMFLSTGYMLLYLYFLVRMIVTL